MDEHQQQVVVCCNAFVVANQSSVVIFIRDITRPKEYEDYLVAYGARKNTVLDTLAHHISGALRLMQHLSAEAEKYAQGTNDKNLMIYLGLLNDNSKHSLEVVYDLLKNEHKASPSILLKNSRIDIVEKILSICQGARQNYLNRTFLFHADKRSLYVNVDEVKLLQILNNFISNAIKYSSGKEPISIKVSDTETEVVISVKDNGIGIPEDLKPLIFQTQFAAGRRGLNGEKSIGLGLSICSNLARLMKGKIWFDSEEGKGSTFYFSLPK